MSNFVNLLDIIYPVGSVYITFSDVSPIDSVGGSWEKIDGKFLYATSTPNQTGGSLQHSHKYGNAYTVWWYSIGGYIEDEKSMLPLMTWDENGQRTLQYGTKCNSNHSFVNTNLTNTYKWQGAFTFENIAQSEYVSTLPPYITCNMYKRIA